MKLFDLPDDTNWKDIPGYKGLYQVSKQGQVRGLGRKLKNSSGHLTTYKERILVPYQGTVDLSKDGRRHHHRVCDLVAQAFIPGYLPEMKVFHIDRSDDDSLENLSLSANKPKADDMWRYIPGYEGAYQVSRDGQVRSVDRQVDLHVNDKLVKTFSRGKVISQSVRKDGYAVCSLSYLGKFKLCSVHRLVAQAFIPNLENKPQVNHIDGNKLNNKVENLEWVTASENMVHARDNGLWNPITCGDISRMQSGIKVKCITDGRVFDSITRAAKFYSMDFESVKESAILHRPRKGYEFRFLEVKDD